MYQPAIAWCLLLRIAPRLRLLRILVQGPLGDGEAFADKMARLTTQLAEQFAESAKLEGEIKKNLAGLGYGGN